MIRYYDAACEYGALNVKRAAFEWLLTNLLNLYFRFWRCLRIIDAPLLYDVLAHPDLFVMHSEFSVYAFLRSWLYFKLHEHDGPADLPDIHKATAFFAGRGAHLPPFLETDACRPYRKPFETLRLRHLLIYHKDMEMLLRDNIVPKSWLFGPVLQQWQSVVAVDESLDLGPSAEVCDDKRFYALCMRCGHSLPESGSQKWRWSGFNFGLDLVLVANARELLIRRHHRDEQERMLTLQLKRNLMVRVTVASLNEFGQVKTRQCTGVQSIALVKNEEQKLLTLDRNHVFPLLISVNLLLSTPPTEPKADEEDLAKLEVALGGALKKAQHIATASALVDSAKTLSTDFEDGDSSDEDDRGEVEVEVT